MADEDRRKNDEAFRFRIIEQLGEIKAISSSTNARIEKLNADVAGNSLAISEIRWALWGGPKESDIGLLEKHRKLARNWTIAVSVCAFLFSALGKIISPLYEKAVATWAYNSVSERWLRQQQRPRVRVYKVIRKKEPPVDPQETGE